MGYFIPQLFYYGKDMIVRITDEFNTTWNVTCDTAEAVLKVIETWLNNREETPIYEILIEV